MLYRLKMRKSVICFCWTIVLSALALDFSLAANSKSIEKLEASLKKEPHKIKFRKKLGRLYFKDSDYKKCHQLLMPYFAELNKSTKLLTAQCLHNDKLYKQEIKALTDFAAIVEREFAIMQLATTDELTLLPNRRGFISTAEHYLDLCIRQHLKAKLVFIDLDNFKAINDKFGHAAGDRVLRDFAGLLENCCRKADLYARLSGDEFVILFTDLNTSECDTIMQRLLLSFSDLPNSFNNQVELGFSYGIADFSDQQPCSLTKLLAVADTRMYADKAQKKAR